MRYRKRVLESIYSIFIAYVQVYPLAREPTGDPSTTPVSLIVHTSLDVARRSENTEKYWH